MLFYVYKKFQLFLFAFALSATALLIVATMADDISQAALEDSISQISFDYLSDVPERVTSQVSQFFATNPAEQAPDDTSAMKQSLADLQTRG